ncbi:MAG TPA: hypothetical protein VFG68_13115 [Fimbriiglobus sp.]|nr:hypothetical protein [Fimbriiglobus sp.]
MDRVTFEDIRPLFGLRLDAPEVAAFLARYVVFRLLRFDLLFRPPAGYECGRTKHLPVLECAFLYRQGRRGTTSSRSRRSGVAFADSRDELVGKLGKPFTSSLAVGLGSLAWEKWRAGEMVIHAMYDRETMTTRVFTLGPEAQPAQPHG